MRVCLPGEADRAVPAGAGGAAAHDDGGVPQVPQDGAGAVHGAAQRAPGAARG